MLQELKGGFGIGYLVRFFCAELHVSGVDVSVTYSAHHEHGTCSVILDGLVWRDSMFRNWWRIVFLYLARWLLSIRLLFD